MPKPWPTTSADQASRTLRERPAPTGAEWKRPSTGRLRLFGSEGSWKSTRYAIVWPRGRPASSTRAVKPESAFAIGPGCRCTSAKDARVDHSTIIRAGRSLRLQTMAPSPLTSPTEAP